MIVASEMKDTKDGTGKFLALTLDVIAGEYQGRKLWSNLNLVNKNEKAVEIAERELSAICHAVGVLNVTDSEQLHGRAMIAKVKVTKRKDTGEPQQSIGTYEPINGGGAPRPNPTPATTPPAHVAAQPSRQSGPATTPPWRR